MNSEGCSQVSDLDYELAGEMAASFLQHRTETLRQIEEQFFRGRALSALMGRTVLPEEVDALWGSVDV